MRRCAVVMAVVWMALAAAPNAGADCTFSDLAWSGDAIRVRVAAGGDNREALVDVATGAVTAVDPRVREPVFSASRRSVLFRDALGVCEISAEGGAPARLRLFLPDATPRFLRAFGADAGGRLLAWTYDRETATHEMWTVAAEGAAPSRVVVPSGPEALRWWREHDAAVAFDRVGGRIVRTACVRFAARPERVCVEPTGRGADGRPRFQLVLGRAGEMGEWARDVVATGLAPAPDSSAVVVGLEEVVASSAGATTWWVTPAQARRIATSAVAAGADNRVRWTRGEDALWLDGAGALWRIDVGAGAATALVPARTAPSPSPFHRVVVARTSDADSAAAWVTRVAAAGFEAGARRDGAAWEVQAGAAVLRAEAEARAAALRGRGFAARLETGTAAQVAPGIGFAATAAARGGRRAFVRNVATSTGMVSELWIQDGDQPPRLRLAAFAGS